jgi:hypothetical protein
MANISFFELLGDFAFGSFLSVIGMIDPALARVGQGLSNAALQAEFADIVTLTDMSLKNIIPQEDYTRQSYRNGFNDEYQKAFLSNQKQHLSPFDLISLFRRGYITREKLTEYLSLNKVVGEDIEQFIKASEYFPTAPDLIRFAIREVYSPEASQKYGQFEDLPEIYLSEAQKAGLPNDQAKNYWAAHWELPSPSMGFEMLHRGVINDEDLALLLKSLDIMPYWREKLTKISYNPLTRVDVRRMYSVGVLKEPDVYSAFLDEGYSPENAKRLTDFTLKYDNPEVDSITRSAIIDSYKKDLLTKDEVAAYFKLLNYTDSVLAFWLENADYEKTVDRITSYTDDIAERYQVGDISLNEARQEVLNLNVPGSYVDSVVEKMVVLKAKRNKNPTLDDIRRWLSTGLIDEVSYVKKMRALGYKDLDIENYLAEISKTRDTSTILYLPVETYIRYVQKGIISPDRFQTILEEKSVSQDEIATYLAKAGVI